MQIEDTTCQEIIATSPIDPTQGIECGRPGHTVIWHQRDGRHVYVMCDQCAYHNVKNRGGIDLLAKTTSPGPWTFDPEVIGCRSIVDSDGEEVVYSPGLANDDQDRRNCELICNNPLLRMENLKKTCRRYPWLFRDVESAYTRFISVMDWLEEKLCKSQ